MALTSSTVHNATKNTGIGDIDVRTHGMECNLLSFDQTGYAGEVAATGECPRCFISRARERSEA
jgi:hypothetical protein